MRQLVQLQENIAAFEEAGIGVVAIESAASVEINAELMMAAGLIAKPPIAVSS